MHVLFRVLYFSQISCLKQLVKSLLYDFSVFRHLDVKLGKSSAHQKTNKETVVEIQESVRGKDVYIIQTGTK